MDLHPYEPAYESSSSPLCYFSLPVQHHHQHHSSHYSIETPSISPVSEYSPDICAEPTNPLLAYRSVPDEHMSASTDASRVLQLQTQAANRPAPDPIQSRYSASPSNSSTSSSSSSPQSSGLMSPSTLCCCRCRRENLAGMYQFSANLYYCSHCAKMVGYSAG